MFEFITILRAIACILITNSHQEEVYPIRLLASGGLLGDAIFFAISGFVLYSATTKKFGSWYLKRLKRVYPPVWITAGIFLVTGIYGAVSFGRVAELMIYPTHYHFVASAVIMYAIYYIFMWYVNKKPNKDKAILQISACIIIIYFIAFYTVFDRSYYHIDNVYSPMIWAVYLLTMLAGMYFRIHKEQYLSNSRIWHWVFTAVLAVAYVASKLAVSRGIIPFALQWINQLVLLVLLIGIFRCFIGFEDKLKKFPAVVKAPFHGIADMAFELYLAQAVIIPTYNTGKDTFPYNFLIVISITFLCAWIVHHLTNILLYAFDMLLKKKKGAASK